MADYVFSLGLIPVQDWIAQARRSRDLRAGSVFLWHTLAKLLTRLEGESTRLGAVEIWTPEPPPRGFEGLARLSFKEALRPRHGLCCEKFRGTALCSRSGISHTGFSSIFPSPKVAPFPT